MADPGPSTDSLDALLRGVSRSFHLSMALLPRGVRAPVATAYLLARATDTVADLPSTPAARKEDLLLRLAEAVGECGLDGGLAAELDALGADHAHGDERDLLARLPAVFAAFRTLPDADRRDVQAVLRHIVRGQHLDVHRFADPGTVQALPNAAALLEYAYLVAGCVGEFWTDVCARHVEDYAERPADEMRRLGCSFGIGLQLVNIVRDVGEDLAAGRCYLPADELAAAGIAPDRIRAEPHRFVATWRRWQEAAQAGLADGMAYAQAVHARRIRAAVALPALIGRGTLARLRDEGPRALDARVKVPRSEVRWLLARMAFSLAGRGMLQAEWDNLAR